MRILTAIFQELASLFVDDGTLAATILIWIAFYGLMLQFLPMGRWQGPILFIGLAFILIENARRAPPPCPPPQAEEGGG
jgi:Ca2+/H+ antiporter, TMEM165/GDT1 family